MKGGAMRQLRIFRIFLATLFFVATVAYLFIGPQVNPMAVASFRVQIILSAITVTIGATIVWLLITLLLGRVYCSTVCPVGTLTDLFARVGRKFPFLRGKAWSWRPASRLGGKVLIVYILCLLIGLMVVPWIIEPWNIMRNIAAAVRPEAVEETWIFLGVGSGVGIVAGAVAFLLIAVWSAFCGREFCTGFCPVGCALGIVGERALMHIEIDPDCCTGCLKCEDVCSARCIKVVSRYVDNTRCLRCFDCLAVCDHNAIRYQMNRNMRMTPLMRRRRQANP